MRKLLPLLLLAAQPLLAQSDSAKFADPRMERIRRLEGKGRHEQACEAYAELAADTAMRSIALRMKATCLGLHQGRPTEALDTYAAAIAWAPRDPANYNERAMFHQEMSMHTKAIADMRYALAFAGNDRDRAAFHSNLASVHMQQQQWQQALAQLDSAMTLDSTDLGVQVNRALTLDELGRHEEGLAILLRVNARHPGHPLVLNNIGYHHARLNEHEASITWYRQALDVQPDNAAALNNLGYAELRTGDRGSALKHIQRSIELDPSNAYAYRNLGHLMKENGDLDKACDAYRMALALGFTARYGPEVKQMKDTYCR